MLTCAGAEVEVAVAVLVLALALGVGATPDTFVVRVFLAAVFLVAAVFLAVEVPFFAVVFEAAFPADGAFPPADSLHIFN
jgi:hypothetical protein